MKKFDKSNRNRVIELNQLEARLKNILEKELEIMFLKVPQKSK